MKRKADSDGEPDVDEIMRKKKFESQAYMQVNYCLLIEVPYSHRFFRLRLLSLSFMLSPLCHGSLTFRLGGSRIGGSERETKRAKRSAQNDHRRHENDDLGDKLNVGHEETWILTFVFFL